MKGRACGQGMVSFSNKSSFLNQCPGYPDGRQHASLASLLYLGTFLDVRAYLVAFSSACRRDRHVIIEELSITVFRIMLRYRDVGNAWYCCNVT